MAHKSVLVNEVIDGLRDSLPAGSTCFEGTAGEGGYSKELAKLAGDSGTLVITDLDQEALDRTKTNLKDSNTKIHLIKSNFRYVAEVIESLSLGQVDALVLDLGLSSYQLDEATRGFSFKRDDPLLMTFDSQPGDHDLTARDVVNEWGEESLADIIFGFGGEKRAKKIAAAIVERRREAPIETSLELAELIEGLSPSRDKIHPATKTFQAIRMAVNDEMGALEQFMNDGWNVLTTGGRMAIVSFHEHEDRLVKRFAKQLGEMGEQTTKKPITPSKDEVDENPRARSAKLRIIEKKS